MYKWLFYIGFGFMTIGAAFDVYAISNYPHRRLERLERFGNFVRIASGLVTSAIFLTWMYIAEKTESDVFPHFAMATISAIVLLPGLPITSKSAGV